MSSSRGEELGICLCEGLQSEGATLTGQVQGDQQHGVVLHVVHLHLQIQQTSFMYLRAILCTFQISVDFYYVPVGGRGGVRGGAGEGGGG
jgi:hypothetical protein